MKYNGFLAVAGVFGGVLCSYSCKEFERAGIDVAPGVPVLPIAAVPPDLMREHLHVKVERVLLYTDVVHCTVRGSQQYALRSYLTHRVGDSRAGQSEATTSYTDTCASVAFQRRP